jgi:hypothetical protein
VAAPGYFKNGTPWVGTAADCDIEVASEKADRIAPVQKRHRNCQICNHEHRAVIEATKVSGAGLDAVAKRFGVHRDALWRHMQRHVSEETRISYLAGPAKLQELANLAADENKSLIEYLGILRSVLFGQLDRSAQLNKPYEVERVGGRALEVLREIGRLTGEVSAFSANNLTVINNNSAVIMNSPLVAEMQTELLTALQPFPEARAAVISAFVRLDERHGHGGGAKLIEGRVNG